MTRVAWPRPAVFTLVGVAGYAIQTLALWVGIGTLGLSVLPATLVATELAVLHNFAWHVRWTWADRPAALGGTLNRLVRFHVTNGAVSLAGGAVLMPALVNLAGLHFLPANLVTVLACASVNYLAGDRLVFAASTRADRG
jgi:putative flippase GtrA